MQERIAVTALSHILLFSLTGRRPVPAQSQHWVFSDVGRYPVHLIHRQPLASHFGHGSSGDAEPASAANGAFGVTVTLMAIGSLQPCGSARRSGLVRMYPYSAMIQSLAPRRVLKIAGVPPRQRSKCVETPSRLFRDRQTTPQAEQGAGPNDRERRSGVSRNRSVLAALLVIGQLFRSATRRAGRTYRAFVRRASEYRPCERLPCFGFLPERRAAI